MIFAATLLLSAVTLLYLYLTWNFDYWRKRGVPGPKPIPLLGNFKSFALRKEHVAYEMQKLYREFKTGRNFAGVFRNRSPKVFVLSPTLAKDILIKSFKNFHDNEFANATDKETDPIFGRNPFMLSGEEWKLKRGEITPAFTSSRMKALFTIVEDVCSRMSTYINNNINTPLEGKELCAKFTTDVVSSCIFAADAQSFTAEKSEIREKGRKLIEPSLGFMLRFVAMSSFPKISKAIGLSFIPKELEHFFTKLMIDAVKFREDNKIQRADYLEYLIGLKNKKEISAVDMAAHGVTFFIDGFETSSVAMSFVLYELAANPKIQDRLRKEVVAAFSDDGTISYETVLELPFLDQVVNETLRLWPPAAFISKKCTESIELDLDSNQKVWINNDVCAIIPIWSMHRDPEYFDEPNHFNPDRFDPAKGGTKVFREKGCFMPFGDGPRQCLGMRFALMQIKRGVCEMVKKFNIVVDSKTSQPLRLDPTNFLTVAFGGIWLRYEPIDN